MKDKLLLLNNKSRRDRIWWQYNYDTSRDNQIPNGIAEKLSVSLDLFIDEIYANYEEITEELLQKMKNS